MLITSFLVIFLTIDSKRLLNEGFSGISVTSVNSQWNYGVDRYAQGPSGSVVFFSALDSRKPSEWTVSDAFHGFVCM
jgi:hypothetical protein